MMIWSSPYNYAKEHPDNGLYLAAGTLGMKLTFKAAPGRVDGRTTGHKRKSHPLDFMPNTTCTDIALPTTSQWER